MNMIKFLLPIPLSFFSPMLYRYIYNSWKGLGLSYLFLLTFILMMPTAFGMSKFNQLLYQNSIFGGAEDGAGYFFTDILDQFPEIVIENGIATTSGPQPQTILNSKTNEPLMIIDTTDSITDFTSRSEIAIINSEYAKLRFGNQEYLYHFKQNLGDRKVIINKDTIISTLRDNEEFITSKLPWMILFLGTIGTVLTIGLKCALFTIFGTVIAKFSNLQAKFSSLFRVAVISSIPSIITEFFFQLAFRGAYLSMQNLIIVLVSVGYFIFAFNVVKSEMESMETNNE